MSNGKPFAKVVPFKSEHLELVDLREQEKDHVLTNPDKYDALSKIGLGGTMVYDGCVLGCFGFFENWPGNYEVWVIPSVHVTRYPAVFLRTIKGKLDRIAETHNVDRFQSPAVSDVVHDKWMRHFGFQEEGIMRRYSNGRDFKMWGRLNDLSSISR